jgi:hypothetical protein
VGDVLDPVRKADDAMLAAVSASDLIAVTYAGLEASAFRYAPRGIILLDRRDRPQAPRGPRLVPPPLPLYLTTR